IESEEEEADKPMYWTDKDGVYKLGLSQKLQADDLKLKKKIAIIGIIGLVLLVVIAILLGLIASTDLLNNVLRRAVC
ncbi:MAG: hypothetical protein KJ847_01750, partial [Firmicutes bacterium]|nr:hypothetical protein [Bacillota bacterium]